MRRFWSISMLSLHQWSFWEIILTYGRITTQVSSRLRRPIKVRFKLTLLLITMFESNMEEHSTS
ncbi:hypothetical protein Goarm_022146 [Gossypium armourianum]|uniref:Uncharacterized protein n=1 Tax=Gossypium armourianum TaxID=34283 RepID=A0A7J9KGY3_9ROSI|nr:hypothetical protein [Gossypium armourianum]